MVKKRFHSLIMVASAVTFIAGCGQGEAGNSANNSGVDKSEPLTLKMYQASANISNEEFNRTIAEPIKAKFPNITMELVRPQTKVSREDLISSGEFPDILFTNTTALQEWADLKLPLDLNPLIKKNSFDVGRFEQRYMDDIKAVGDKGQLFGLPFSRNFDVLFYNKDVFDKFAIAYPKDGMTWDETIELGRRVTRQENGVKYEGIYPTHMRYFATQLSLPFINAKTEKPELTTDGWKRVLETYKAISDASGVLDPAHALNRFNRDRTLAMLTHFGARLGEFEQFHKDGNPLNWDMVTYPSFKEKPGISQGPDTHYLLVNSASKHADAAFQVISYLVSDESQIHMAKGGRLSALKNPKINEQFGVNLQTLKGKNVQAIFKSTPASLPDPTRYDTFVTENIQKYVKTYLNGEVDVNTMIRQLEDFVNKEIEVQKKRQ